MEAEGVSRWVSRESEVKWQLDVADLSRSRVGECVCVSVRDKEREGGRKSKIRPLHFRVPPRHNCSLNIVFVTNLTLFLAIYLILEFDGGAALSHLTPCNGT